MSVTPKIWIIGASSGIGAALARAYAADGADVVISARSLSGLQEVAAGLANIRILPLDLTQKDALPAAAATLPAGSFDAIICTAALYDPGKVADIDLDALDQLLRVNLYSQFQLAQCAPQLLRDGGQLVLFGSVAGYMGLPKGQPYSATKAALINLAESLRIELAPRVDVRLVCPGFVETRLTAKNDFAMPAMISADEAAARIIKGLRGRGFEIHFPRRFTLGLKLLRALPYRLSLALTRKLG